MEMKEQNSKAEDTLSKEELQELYHVGNKVTFGEWEGKPIVWRVMEAQGQLRLLLADEILTHLPYNNQYIDSYWNTCSLRKWLNQDFAQKCFTLRERMSMINTRVKNRSNPKWESAGGPMTVDKVFIPDIEEAEHFLPDPEDRELGSWWWLRNPGSSLLSVACVYTDGTIYDYGINNSFEDGGVRPMMWIRIHQ